MYTTKLSFIYLSLILFRNQLLTICIAEKTLFIIAVVTDRSNDNFISIYTNENIKFFFCFYHFLRKTSTSNTFNTRELIIFAKINNICIKLVTKYRKVHYREFIGIKKVRRISFSLLKVEKESFGFKHAIQRSN